MNDRGQYGRSGYNGHSTVGAQFEYSVELKQRYEGVKTDAVATLMRDLSRDGTLSAISFNRWEVTLPNEAARIRGNWYADANVLVITISDMQLRPLEQTAPIRRHYEALLSRITAQLRGFGATAVGVTVFGPSSTQRPVVGITLYHSVGDRADAVKQMAIDWDALYQNLASQVGELTRDPKSPSGYRIATQAEWDANPPDPKKVAWWKSNASPLIKQWVKFKHDQLGGDKTVAADYIAFAERFQTTWDVYESWKKKLDMLRAEAQKRGFTITASSTTNLPTTVWADVGDVAKGAASDVWKLAKYAVYGVLGLGAIVALTSVASNLRSGKDPAEKYTELIRTSRRSRAPRALPERDQLALPPGEPA